MRKISTVIEVYLARPWIISSRNCSHGRATDIGESMSIFHEKRWKKRTVGCPGRHELMTFLYGLFPMRENLFVVQVIAVSYSSHSHLSFLCSRRKTVFASTVRDGSRSSTPYDGEQRPSRRLQRFGRGNCQELHPGRHCLLYTSPSPRDQRGSRMPSSA